MSKNIGPHLCSDTSRGTNILYSNGDWLTSKNGIYRTIMHDNGRFFVYAGGGKEVEVWFSSKPTQEHTHCICLHDNGELCIYLNYPEPGKEIWTSKSGQTKKADRYWLYLHDDGNLCIYPNSPENNKPIWESGGKISPIEKITRVLNIEYHSERAKIKRNNITLLERTLKNDTDNTQEYILKYDKTTVTSHKWSRKDDIKALFTSSFKIGIPKVSDDGRITIEGSYDYVEDITFTENIRLKNTIKVSVKPHTEIHAKIIITDTKLEVLYTLKGQAKLKSGQIVDNYIAQAVFSNNNIHSPRMICKEKNLKTNITNETLKYCPTDNFFINDKNYSQNSPLFLPNNI
ncbi:MAG: ETX/MTX2 family pore-forming toxin [Nitrososphaerota archaeon]|jgi:hypothetical protein|nr:ETX/MTX2 family pore-forming toxin [Nitrososphaerota archaeon]